MTRLADLILAAAEDKRADGIQCGAQPGPPGYQREM